MKICQEHIEAFERHLFQNETAKSTIGVPADPYKGIAAVFSFFFVLLSTATKGPKTPFKGKGISISPFP